MPLAAGGGAFCPFCGSHQKPAALPTGMEGVALSEQTNDLPCPLCRAALREARVADRPASACTACGGLLCAMEHFAAIVQTRRQEYSGPENAPRLINPAEFERSLRCPKCSATMGTYPYGGGGSVVIDTCLHCGLIWLDAGELSALERAPGRR